MQSVSRRHSTQVLVVGSQIGLVGSMQSAFVAQGGSHVSVTGSQTRPPAQSAVVSQPQNKPPIESILQIGPSGESTHAPGSTAGTQSWQSPVVRSQAGDAGSRQ